MEPHSGERRPVWTVSLPKTAPKSVWRELEDLSTIFHGSTQSYITGRLVEEIAEALGWSLALGRGGLTGLSNDEIQPETRSQELIELATMSYWSTLFDAIHKHKGQGYVKVEAIKAKRGKITK